MTDWLSEARTSFNLAYASKELLLCLAHSWAAPRPVFCGLDPRETLGQSWHGLFPAYRSRFNRSGRSLIKSLGKIKDTILSRKIEVICDQC